MNLMTLGHGLGEENNWFNTWKMNSFIILQMSVLLSAHILTKMENQYLNMTLFEGKHSHYRVLCVLPAVIFDQTAGIEL